ncbi:MAG: dihydroneopterin aldolase [Gammaproteobacteria bacterium]|nr:dihydroneopterin aldolase [Gammaproteobacteria bacterium]MDH5276552.1 dihydroneopterin aldolase [Gammaproteobacteria bacterium]
MDTIFLRDLRVRTIVGIWDWERRLPQVVSIDLDMATDIRRAAGSDDIGDTLDYKGVTNRIRSFVAESRFQLIETMAEQIAAIIIDEFKVPWVRVVVHKPRAIRDSQDVGVAIERGKRS